MTRWGTDNLPPGVTPGHRPPSPWRDGLRWAFAAAIVAALIVGLAIGQVVYGG